MTSYRFQNGGVGKDRGKTGERKNNEGNKFSGERPGKNERYSEARKSLPILRKKTGQSREGIIIMVLILELE